MWNKNSRIANNLPDLADLKVFCLVARKASFSAAAAELGMSAAYVTKRIAVLEGLLGVRLFHRTTRQVRISDEGELVFEWASALLDDVAGLPGRLNARTREPAGPLRVASSIRLGRQHVSHALSLLQRRYPKLDIWLELLDRRVDLIGENFDIDIRVGEPIESNLIAHRIVRSSRVLCASPDYLAARGTPAALADLADHDCLPFRDRDHALGIWRLQGRRGEETVKVGGRLGSNHSDVARTWGLKGHGIVLLSLWDVTEHLRDGSLVRVLPDYEEPADVWAMSSRRTAQSAKVKVCIDFLREQLTGGEHALNVTP